MFKVWQTYEIWPLKSPKCYFLWKLRLAHHRPRITLQSIYHGSKVNFDLLRQQSEKFYFRVSGVAGDRFLMNFTSFINFHYEWIFHPMFRFWTEPQTIKYHESEALALHVRSWTPKLILKNYPRGFEFSKYLKLTKSGLKNLRNVS